ncbi:uncharacterized protein [Drosophila virilis]|uniref:N-acetyltransferase domain-containing protein n=1 Tax=Drosophila virilis TaxID=7244 RepID=B4LZD7_DROVI|nr:uncharacterized protein LOC6630794 [Drosophila virilis]EDW68172.1 uncharacterized protein Dvir_GJ24572 [Drosophila virilis]
MRAQNGKLWSTLHEGKYEVCSLAREDLEEALNVLDDSFFINESVCIACEINLPQNTQARQELRELCRITAQDGVSLIMRHVESCRIVAVSFNKLQFAPPPGEDNFFVKFYNEQVKSPQAKSLMNYMITMDSKIDVFAEYNLDCVCELMFLATLPEFRRLGLGRALVESTVQLTRELGQGRGLQDVAKELQDKRPAAVTALWTSVYTQKIGNAVGFMVLNTVPFNEFEFNGKRFNERIGPEHEFSQQAMYKL